MAIAIGASASAGSSVSNTTTTAGVTTQTSGSTFVIGVVYPNGDTISSISDSKSNTYSLINQTADPGDGFKVAMYYCANGSGGSGHTATAVISSTDPKAVFFAEITGASASPLDQSSGALDTSSPFDSSVTITQNNEIVISLLGSNSSGSTVTWNGGYTGLLAETGWLGAGLGYRITSATGTYSPAATTSSGLYAVVVTASFFEASSTVYDPITSCFPIGYYE